MEKLVEKHLRDLLKDASSLEGPQRLDAIKLGIDWIKANRKTQSNQYGSFFNQEASDGSDG